MDSIYRTNIANSASVHTHGTHLCNNSPPCTALVHHVVHRSGATRMTSHATPCHHHPALKSLPIHDLPLPHTARHPPLR